MSFKLRSDTSVVHAELFGIMKALQYVESKRDYNNYIILTDCKSALHMLIGRGNSYQDIVGKICKLLLELNEDKSVILQWIKGHAHIKGNNTADLCAKKGHSLDKTVLHSLSKEEVLNTLKARFIERWNELWVGNTDLTDTGLHLRRIREKIKHRIPYIFKKRREEVVLYRLRIGHVGVKKHMHRFQMSESPTCEECDIDETVDHYLLHCGKYELEREAMRRRLREYGIPSLSLKIILGGDPQYASLSRTILKELLKYIHATGRLNEL